MPNQVLLQTGRKAAPLESFSFGGGGRGMVIRLLVGTCLGFFLTAGLARSEDDTFEAKSVRVVGTLRQHESPAPAGPPGGFFVEVNLKGVGLVKQPVDFSGDAESEKQAAGWVGKRLAVEGKAEYREVKPSTQAGPKELGLVVKATKVSLAADK